VAGFSDLARRGGARTCVVVSCESCGTWHRCTTMAPMRAEEAELIGPPGLKRFRWGARAGTCPGLPDTHGNPVGRERPAPRVGFD
jgi:hypothetical protein